MDAVKYHQLIEPAVRLLAKKGEDYNRSTVKLHDYFPFGHKSYVQMIYLKAMRLRSLTEGGGEPNFDSIEDTLYDSLNYIVFYLERLAASKELEARGANPKA